MQINTIKAVNASDFFKDFQPLKEVLQNGEGYDFSWGDNNHSLVDVDTIVNALEEQVDNVDSTEFSEYGIFTEDYWDKFLYHVGSLPKDVYIDLEN